MGAERMTSPHDAREFRDALGHFASGVTVVAGIDAGAPAGFTCQSFSSVSIDPPLVSFSVMRESTTYPGIRASGSFAVSVLADGQHEIARQFARRGTDKWAGIDWSPAASGNPVLADALIWADCTLWAEYDAGDHLIVVGEVRELGYGTSTLPLLFFRGAFHSLHSPSPAVETTR